MLFVRWKWALVVPGLLLAAACGGGGEGTPDAGSNCSGSQVECSGVCTDTQIDRLNCGTCGTVCGTGTTCVAGSCVASCGDGIVAGTEACDDGDNEPGDGCSDTCTIETGYACMGSPSVCTPGCGDGLIVGMEACDDGDKSSGDGCSAACAIEEGYTCTGEPSVCTTTCGDGVVAGTEECDDQDTQSGDGCSDTCTVEAGFTCTGEPSVCTATCGDGVVAGTESCDDMNQNPNDGCSPTCTVEDGYHCTGEPSVCTTVCGDGMIAGSETCDDGDTASGDGCSEFCTQEAGYICQGSPSVCTPVCGDGFVVSGEPCDDGNFDEGDGCSATCTVEPGFACSGEPSVCVTTCGDGVVAGDEECDDGNPTASDGCDPVTCKVDPGYYCSGMPSVCAPVLTCPAGSTLTTFASTDLPKNFGATSNQSNIVLTNAGVVLDLAVEVSVTHPFVEDVELTLMTSSGVSIHLTSTNGGSGEDYIDTIFVDSATTSIVNGSAPFTGLFKPEQPLSAAFGSPVSGTWSLLLADGFPDADDGTLTEFTLHACVCTTCEIGSACSDGIDNDADGDLDCADSDCSNEPVCAVCGNGVIEAGETCDDGNTITGDGCTGTTCRVEPGASCSGTPSVCNPGFQCPSGYTAVTTTATGLGLPVGQAAPVSFVPLTVTAPGVVGAAFVGFNASHAFVSDLAVFLASPDGRTATLAGQVGGDGVDFVDTFFSDSAATSIGSGTAPFTGSFKPTLPLSTFNGVAAAGTWTVAVNDLYPSLDDGTVHDVFLHLCVSSTVESGDACKDGVDNDGDGQTDCADTDCASTPLCTCGNGTIDPGETCDDANTNPGDGCSETCSAEVGFDCTGTPSACTPQLVCPSGSTLKGYAARDLPKTFGPVPTASLFPVLEPGVVTAGAMRVDITHTFVEDVSLFMVSPTFSYATLASQLGGSGQNYTNTFFTDAAPTSITTASPPFTGAFKPQDPISSLAGELASGVWWLAAEDAFEAEDDGTVNQAELLLCICTTCETGMACGDGVDNDGDGQTDCADSDCAGQASCP